MTTVAPTVNPAGPLRTCSHAVVGSVPTRFSADLGVGVAPVGVEFALGGVIDAHAGIECGKAAVRVSVHVEVELRARHDAAATGNARIDGIDGHLRRTRFGGQV